MKGRNERIWGPEVKYEALLRATCTYKRYCRATDVVYKFLKSFPKLQEFDKLNAVDVQDWLVLRGRQCAARTVNDERIILRNFFKWLVQEGFALKNPFLGTRKTAESQVLVEFDFEDLQRLVQSGDTAVQRQLVQQLLAGKDAAEIASDLSLHPSTVRKYWRCLRTAAAFPPLPMKHFQRAYSRLCTRFGEHHLWKSLNLSKPE